MKSSSSGQNGFRPCPPGSCFTDQSVELYRDIVSFFNRRLTQHKSPIFNARILMKTTTLVGSNAGVHQVLNECAESFQLGYKDYFSHIYGDVILFAEGVPSEDMRAALMPMFHRNSVDGMTEKMEKIISGFFSSLDLSQPVCIYSMFKQLCSEIMISLFLDLSPTDNRALIDQIISLSVTHWHGIISLPFTWKMPLGIGGGCRKALDAKEGLVGIVRDLWDGSCDRDSFLYQFKHMPFSSEEVALDHLVLLVTALVPKAFASILTSCLLLSDSWSDCRNPDRSISDEDLDCVLLEVGRLWPPFVAGRRIAKQNVDIEGFSIPAGRPVIFLVHSAHRDPRVFANPDEFSWKRWKAENLFDRHNVFWFGGGGRSCIGNHLADFVLKTVLRAFLNGFDWKMDFSESSIPLYKWLPVSRPKNKPTVSLRSRRIS